MLLCFRFRCWVRLANHKNKAFSFFLNQIKSPIIIIIIIIEKKLVVMKWLTLCCLKGPVLTTARQTNYIWSSLQRKFKFLNKAFKRIWKQRSRYWFKSTVQTHGHRLKMIAKNNNKLAASIINDFKDSFSLLVLVTLVCLYIRAKLPKFHCNKFTTAQRIEALIYIIAFQVQPRSQHIKLNGRHFILVVFDSIVH